MSFTSVVARILELLQASMFFCHVIYLKDKPLSLQSLPDGGPEADLPHVQVSQVRSERAVGRISSRVGRLKLQWGRVSKSRPDPLLGANGRSGYVLEEVTQETFVDQSRIFICFSAILSTQGGGYTSGS